ncbi:TonB family protein [Marinobacter salinisoli]|uniref:TonB family protein n=1 Tax=Marinobacter salinisoli TaxID=2769486 RepID=A0ABX7MV77_9GAMM|nr:TonB family protein [Marinobacter salinisoli]QSP96280.1 TonB family protein [Marinobacter salinisoli]
MPQPSSNQQSGSSENASAPDTRNELAVAQADGRDTVNQVTSTPAEQDPYIVTLAIHLGQQIERMPIAGINQLREKASLEVELQLLDNGALTRSRLLKSSGNKRLDNAVYHASLAASPYPAPPEHYQGQSRFEIQLIYSPKRL